VVFSSTLFLLYFLPLFLLVYHLAPQRFRNGILLAASVVFYAWGAPKFIFVIIASTVIDFYLVRQMFRATEQSIKRRWLTLSVVLNLGLLLYFKYANFFVDNVNAVLMQFKVLPIGFAEVLLPIGISFYTFQTLTYAVDVYRGDGRPLERLSDYLLYILSFPQMIAGPIVRFNAVAAQITHRVERIDDKLLGFYRFTIGLCKKVLIANVMGEQAELVFQQPVAALSSADAWVGLLAYTFQIYYDFSGYSDMAIGLGRMMGFRFPENFNAPYIAQSITEFWRRWHITLGSFMRDYLYIPLGGNRVKQAWRLYLNLGLVFLLSGLWHGASWNFVLWGAFHGALLICDRLFMLKTLQRLGTAPAVGITFFLVMMGWVVFRIEDSTQIAGFYQALFAFDGRGMQLELVPGFKLIAAVATFFAFIMLFDRTKRLGNFFKRQVFSPREHVAFGTVSVLFFILATSAVVASGFNPFIYFRF
jgi:alginate O-acetyltransferase complex protein AlgI